jgi:hypothetical protein
MLPKQQKNKKTGNQQGYIITQPKATKQKGYYYENAHRAKIQVYIPRR